MKSLPLLFLCLFAVLLVGCSPTGGLRAWIEEENTAARQKYQPFFGKKRYAEKLEPYDFTLNTPNMIEPFSPEKLRILGAPGSIDARGILESYDLSEMKYVGYLAKKSGNKGLIDIDNQVFIISVGAPIGKNYGKVMSITPRAVVVEEHVEDGAGTWITTKSELELTKNNE